MASKGQGQVIESLHGLFFVHFDGFNFYRYNTVVVLIPYVLLVVVRSNFKHNKLFMFVYVSNLRLFISVICFFYPRG